MQNMENRPLLSLCIPTNGIVEWVIPAIESIYCQNVDKTLFEVVVTDNGETDNLEHAISKFVYPNLHYYRTQAQGFTNQIDAFEKCSGVFCKMLNHRCKMLPDAIKNLIGVIEKYRATKPIIYCAEGHGDGGDFIECEDTDEFVSKLGYWTSWSAGVGAWKEDLVNLRQLDVDDTFPHLVFILGLRKKSKYVIWNPQYEIMTDDTGKGGYDVFHAFAVHLLDLNKKLRDEGRITSGTFRKYKRELFQFLCNLYYNEVLQPSKHTFILKDIHKSMITYYGELGYWLMLVSAYAKYGKSSLKRIVKNVI